MNWTLHEDGIVRKTGQSACFAATAAEKEFWARIKELELESESSMEAAIALLEDRPMKQGGFPHLLFCNGGNHERIGDGIGICNCPLGKRIRGLKKRIQELELALTEIATRTRLFQKIGGAVQQVLSAEQMIEIAEKALNPPQQQQPKPPHTNQDQIPPQNPEPRLLDSRTGF